MTTMKTSLKATLIAAAIAGLPLGSHAAGLGALNVYSALGQPLRGEIELQATAEELKSLAARVAPPAAFQAANIGYSPVMTNLRLGVETRGNRSFVTVSSDRPINEPFVELLVEVTWSSGRMVRGYTFLLDPVEMAAPAAVAVAPTAPAAVATPRPAVRPAATAPMAAPSDGYRVRRGDTLHGIASRHLSAGVNLDQMMIALLRDNPDAFDGQNINRLKAGAILRIPDAASASAASPAEARREILAQAADFEAYRARLAGTVAARPAAPPQPVSREAAGEIVPRVAEAPRAETPADRVEVSGGPTDGTEAGRLARLQALEEELVARERSLEEANERLAELEKSIRDLQRLIELRNESLAQLQQQVAPGAPAQEAAPPARQPEAAAPVQTTPQPVQPARAPAPPVAPQPTFLQTMLEDPMLLAGGGGILALLLGYAGYKVRVRRKEAEGNAAALSAVTHAPSEAQSVFGAQGGQSVDTGSSILHTDFSQSGLAAIDADEGVDPVAEADVYMAYGRDAQAEEILLDALKADASRAAISLKLLEIYAQRRNLKQFESIATDLYSRTGGEGEDWKKAAAMGRELDSENPLYHDRSSTLDAEDMTEPGGRHGTPGGTRARDAGLAARAAVFGGAALASEARPAGAPELDVQAGTDDFGLTSSVLGNVSASQLKDTWAMPGSLDELNATNERAAAASEERAGALAPEAAASSEGDFSVLDFDLDEAPATVAGGPSGQDEKAAGQEPKAADGGDHAMTLEFDLGTSDETPAQEAGGRAASIDLSRTVAADELDLAAVETDDASALNAVEFDLDVDVPNDGGANVPSVSATVVADEIDLGLHDERFELDTKGADVSAASRGREADRGDEAMNATLVIGDVGRFSGVEEFSVPGSSDDVPTRAPEFDPNATLIESDLLGAGERPAASVDLEKSTFDNDLLDFDFDLEAGTAKDEKAAPALDLSSIDLDLELPEVPAESVSAEPAAMPSPEVLQEVDTKLDLARAYDEMGDKEGARELLEEVLGEGSSEQREKARRLLDQLG